MKLLVKVQVPLLMPLATLTPVVKQVWRGSRRKSLSSWGLEEKRGDCSNKEDGLDVVSAAGDVVVC
jgi:hypothetical protein